MHVQHFATILNFLRDAECELPASARERKELLREAEFYEVSPLPEPHLPSLCPGLYFMLWTGTFPIAGNWI